jgi:nucleoside-diphosphate-sugar epimerase
MRVFVTGVDGFIGARLGAVLTRSGHTVKGVSRKDTGDIGPQTQWAPLLVGSDAVIHLANRAHVTHESNVNPLQEFRRVNVLGTLRLAKIAQQEGVGRFVFVSSIGVNGVQTLGASFTEKDRPNPVEPYAISKLEAEEELRSLAIQSKVELVIVRPPLVYGPNAKGNFHRLIRMVDKGVPLPLGSVRNLRSFVGVDNLAELLGVCVEHPAAAGQLFLAADGHDVSTPELLDTIARAMRRRPRVFRFPLRGLRLMAALAGFGKELERLTGSLQVDASRAADLLDWRAAKTFDAGIEEMVHSYLSAV